MNVEALAEEVRAAMAAARDSLGRIEIAAREGGEAPSLFAASRAYAQFCMHGREFVHGVEAHRPFPRRFAEKTAETLTALAALGQEFRGMGLKPTVEELERLRQAALAAQA